MLPTFMVLFSFIACRSFVMSYLAKAGYCFSLPEQSSSVSPIYTMVNNHVLSMYGMTVFPSDFSCSNVLASGSTAAMSQTNRIARRGRVDKYFLKLIKQFALA